MASHNLPSLSLFCVEDQRNLQGRLNFVLKIKVKTREPEDLQNGFGLRDGQLWPHPFITYLLSGLKIPLEHFEWYIGLVYFLICAFLVFVPSSSSTEMSAVSINLISLEEDQG